MTALQNAAAMLRDLRHHPDSFSPVDLAIQCRFARLTLGKRGISQAKAYAAYERSVQRENSHAAIVGSTQIALVDARGFSAVIKSFQIEQEAAREVRRRRTIH